MPSIHIPGTLLGILLVLVAVDYGVKSISGLFVLITGLWWLYESLGIAGRLRR